MNVKKSPIYLDNRRISNREFMKILGSIQDKNILKLRGGFLFQSCLKESDLYIGIIPAFMEGERGHHYDIKLDYSDEFKFSGNFNADGTLGMVFFPPVAKEELSKEYLSKIKQALIKTISIFIDHGLSRDMKLDWMTQKIIEEVELFDKIPEITGELIQSLV